MMEYDRLVAEHKDAIYRNMVRVCGNREDAEDVLIDALVAAYRHSQQLRDDGAFRSWVTTIGRRLCSHLRNKNQIQVILQAEGADLVADTSEDAQELLERKQLSDCVHSAVASLPQIYRETYVECEIAGNDLVGTATKLGISVGAVKSRLHRARAIVREALDRSVCMAPEAI